MTPSEINVDQLMRQIRQAVAQRAGETSRNGEPTPPAAENVEQPVGQIDGSRLTLQPDFQASQNNGYHANDLLKYHGETFVRNAYRAILKREPDADGMGQNLAKLADGKFNKIDVLASLRYSAEGEQAGVNISGLAWPATVRRIERVPVIGYLVQVAIALTRLPAMLTHQRQYEFYALARQEQIVDYANRINESNAQLAERANEFSARALTIENDIRGQQQALESVHGESKSALGALQNEIVATSATLRDVEARAAALASQLSETAATLETAIADQKSTQTHWQEEFQTLTTARQQLLQELGVQQRRLEDLYELAQVQTGLNEEGLDELYAAFEDQFRGEREEIKTRLRVYLPILERANATQDLLDIGCGRGEWLELLRESGKQGRGVDHNRVFIERCQRLGLDVVQRDAIAYLSELPDASLDAITSFHLVEHLPFKVLMQLLDEMARVLRPGSPLILETPNPENFIVGSHTFYADPTHRNPIPSATLSFLLASRGLTDIEVMHVRPWEEAKIAGDDELTKRFNEYFYGSPDYGIVGWKK
ncbi:MAG TPA: methyltransferase domain-containing protein [Pyrinomonadaceae bacterium]